MDRDGKLWRDLGHSICRRMYKILLVFVMRIDHVLLIKISLQAAQKV